LLTVYSKVHN